MSDTVYKIEGMSCNHCKMAVETAIKEVAGVTGVEVNLDKGEAKVTGSPDFSAIANAVDEAGFKVLS